MISVRILAPDLVEVTVRPSWLARVLGKRPWMACAANVDGYWLWCHEPAFGPDPADRIGSAIGRAFFEADAQRRAETARNYQAAAQRGEYPIR